MIKDEKDIDFYTTGRQPSEEEFACISAWRRKDKEKQDLHKSKKGRKRTTSASKSIRTSGVGR